MINQNIKGNFAWEKNKDKAFTIELMVLSIQGIGMIIKLMDMFYIIIIIHNKGHLYMG